MDARAIRLVLAALLLAGAAPQVSHAAGVNVYCEGLTKIEGCVECTNTNGAKCFACHKDRGPSWAQDGRVTECRTTTIDAAARTASSDPNCRRADGQWCIECKANFFFDAAFKCVTSTAATPAARTLEICQKTSRNTNCIACNPDGTCTKCRNNLILVPQNAMFINAFWAESRCMAVSNLNTEARSITWQNAVVPSRCIEVDSDFKCTRCQDGFSLTGGTCKLFASGSKCAATVGYRHYCAVCNAAGTACTQCNGSRSIVGGACSLPCKQLYGVGCKRCNASTCLEGDTAYSNGRR